MECNKDEAIRAKEVAEKKMHNDEFEGARKFAQKAQRLFPELENISQLLTVCDVHCSAQNKICGTEMDWYGILQMERFSDEANIKKQYRKLALVLHPDKNKFPGAEAAFKLIGEANMVLSDKGKRSLYDSKCRFSMRTAATNPPSRQVNKIPGDRKQYVPTQPSLSNGRQAFWTSCPFCNMRYQYYRDFVNRALRCQNCAKPFIAYDLGAQNVPPVSSNSQPAFPQQKQAQSQEQFKVGSQSTGGFPPPHMGHQGSFSNKTVGSEPVSRTGSTADVVGGGSKINVEKDGHARKVDGKEGVGSAKVDTVKPKKSGTSRNTTRKRGRKLVVESSESCDAATSADTEDVIIQENGDSSAGQNSGLNGIPHTRRSFRRRQNVSYNEGLNDDDDFVSPPKRSKGNGLSSEDNKEELKEAFNNGVAKTDNSTGFAAAVDRDKEDIKRKGNAHLKGSLPNGSGEAAEHGVNREEAAMADCNAKTSEVIDDSELVSDSDCAPNPEYYECPDSEFNDFDKDKEDNCFAVDQIWACYDPTDGMPRFYARVRKVFSPGFRLRIIWLEPDPEEQDEINWVNEDLPIACGKFFHGNPENLVDRLIFSHQVHCEKGSSRGSFMIYPRKGETWALFKDWDVSWSSDAENHKNYKFEIMEIISDFVEGYGVRVAYLDKVKGFVSLFQPTTREGIVSFLIPPTELLRFSHRIPSFKMTGTEREGVPKGSFELDPASLPIKFDECGDVKMEASPEKGVKFMKSAEKLNTPKKDVGFEWENDLEKEKFKLRRSPRDLSKDKKYNQMNASQCPIKEGTAKDDLDSADKKHVDLTPSKGRAPCNGDEKLNLPMNESSPQSFAKCPSVPPSFSPGGKILEEFHNFEGDKSEGKFQLGQIWALYNIDSNHRLPTSYAQIKKIGSCPFQLHVAMLEPCTHFRDRMQAVCCGTFKLQTGKPRIFSPSSFSHALKEDFIGKNRFDIYPREGEIWALYKDWNADMSCSDLKDCKYELVEVLEDNEHCTKVSPLIRLNGYKSVFKAPRRQRSGSGAMEIPRVELARFSHQIPSFKLTEEKDGRLKGFWELDPDAIPDFSS